MSQACAFPSPLFVSVSAIAMFSPTTNLVSNFRVADIRGLMAQARLSVPMQLVDSNKGYPSPLSPWVRTVEADFRLAVAGCRFYSCCWPVVPTIAGTSGVM
jgi:hypothetical protein